MYHLQTSARIIPRSITSTKISMSCQKSRTMLQQENSIQHNEYRITFTPTKIRISFQKTRTMPQEETQFRTTLRTMHLEAHTSQSNHDHAEQLKFQHISEQYKYGEICLRNQFWSTSEASSAISKNFSRAKSAQNSATFIQSQKRSTDSSKQELSPYPVYRSVRILYLSRSFQGAGDHPAIFLQVSKTYSRSSKFVFIRQAPDELIERFTYKKKRYIVS